MPGPWDNYSIPDVPPPAPPPQDSAQPPLRFTVRPEGVKEPPKVDTPPSSGPWSKYEEPSVLGDVAKSAGIGVVKGGIGMAGLLGDARGAIETGVDALSNWIISKATTPEDQEKAQQVLAAFKNNRPARSFPTSAEVRKTVEDQTGPLYEPKTRAGRDAQAVGEFVPGALAGPGGTLAKIIKFAAIPGVASEEAGHATEGTALEPYKPYVKAGTAIATGGAAALVGRPATASRAIREQLPDYVTDVHVGQADAIIADAAARGVTLTWPEALSQVVGRPVLTDMQRVLESSPRTRAAMQDVHGGRPQEIATAAEGEFNNIVPASTSPSTVGPAVGTAADESVQGVRQAINRAADPFYRGSENVVLTPAEMAQVRAIPGYQTARDAVRNDEQLNRYVAHLPDNSVGFLNEVKKQLDRAATDATNPLSPRGIPNQQRAAGLTTDAATVRQAAIDADRTRGPLSAGSSSAYEVALGVEQQARERFLDPLLQGPLGRLADKDITTQKAISALFPEKPLFGSADEVSTAVSALAQRNPWAARQLVRAHLEQKLDEAFNAAGRGQEAAQFAGASFASKTLGSPVIGTQKMQNVRAAVEALPNGPQIWDGLSRFFEIAQATGTRQPIGSKTAFNEQELRNMASGSMVGNAAKTGLSPARWMSWASDAATKWQLGQNLDQLARIITDPNSGRLLQRIARAPRGSREAQLTAARVIAGSNASAADRRQSQEKP